MKTERVVQVLFYVLVLSAFAGMISYNNAPLLPPPITKIMVVGSLVLIAACLIYYYFFRQRK